MTRHSEATFTQQNRTKMTFLKKILLLCFIISLTTCANGQEFQNLFNGKDLDGWSGQAGFWSVQDGAIVGETTKENPAKPNTFLVWDGGEVADFELICKVRFRGNNSGVQYRSEVTDPVKFALKGYQADLHPKPEYFGMIYSEKTGRGIIAQRFTKAIVKPNGKTEKVAKVGDPNQNLTDWEWNTLRIVAVGNNLVHQINGVNTIELTDRHPDALSQGVLGLQLHAGPSMRVEFKDIQYRPLTGSTGKKLLKAAQEKPQESKSEK